MSIIANLEQHPELSLPHRGEIKPVITNIQHIREGRQFQTYTQYDFNGVATNALSFANFSTAVAKGQFDRFTSFWLRFEIEVINAAITLAPTTSWFDRIEMRFGSGGEIFRTFWNDTLQFNMFSALTNDELKGMGRLMNFDTRPNTMFGVAKPIGVGTRYFYLPLPHNVFEDLHASVKHATSDLNFTFYPDSTGVCVAGSMNNLVLKKITLMMDVEKKNEEEELALERLERKYVKTCLYLDPVRYEESGKYLSPGTQYKFSLTSLDGLISHFLLFVRPVGSKSNVGYLYGNTVNLGDEGGADLDILDGGNQSVYGNGRAIPAKWLRCYLDSVEQLQSDYLINEPKYVIPFTKSVGNANKGVMDGVLELKSGNNFSLAFTPRAGLPEIFTLNLTRLDTGAASVAADGGYRFKIGNEVSIALNYDATVANMKAAVEAMDFCKKRNLSVAFSATFAAANSITATFTCPESYGLEEHKLEVEVYNLNNAGNEIAVQSVVSQGGYGGLAAGQYDISLYAFYYKRATWLGDTLKSQTLH